MLATIDISTDTLPETLVICVTVVLVVWLIWRARREVNVTIHFKDDSAEPPDERTDERPGEQPEDER